MKCDGFLQILLRNKLKHDDTRISTMMLMPMVEILTLEYACLCVCVTKRPHLTHYPQANTLSTAAPKLDSG